LQVFVFGKRLNIEENDALSRARKINLLKIGKIAL
jgi:hypothetical protein